MALKSTIYKASLSIADIDHHYYADHQLTLARHPSETDERVMARLVALSLNAWKLQAVCNGDATLEFGAGVSNPDEPDVWLRDFTGRTRSWIEVGQPEDKPLGKACSRADEVLVYAFHHAASVWWKGIASKLERMEKLQVFCLDSTKTQALVQLVSRQMTLQATVQEGALLLGDGKNSVSLEPTIWKS